MNRILSIHSLMIAAVIVLAALSIHITNVAEDGWMLPIIIAIVTACYLRFLHPYRETAPTARR